MQQWMICKIQIELYFKRQFYWLNILKLRNLSINKLWENLIQLVEIEEKQVHLQPQPVELLSIHLNLLKAKQKFISQILEDNFKQKKKLAYN